MSKIYAYQVVGDGLVMLSEVGGGRPDQGLPGGGGGRPVDPGFGVGDGGHPSQPIHHPGHPDHGLPSSPGRPSHPIAGGGAGIPDNSLPSAPPPTLLPGYTLVMVRSNDGKWHYAAIKPGVAPPIALPEPIPPGGAPDQGLPPQPPPTAGQLPGQTPTPKS